MKHAIHESFFRRNTEYGVWRYLSTLGFTKPYEFIPANPGYFYAVCGSDIPNRDVEVVKSDILDSSLMLVVAVLLMEAGYDTVEAVHNASDEDLLKIDGIGKGRLRKIRELAH